MSAPAPISDRARKVIAYSYDQFPVAAGHLDLRADNSPPLSQEFTRPVALAAAPAGGYGPVPGHTGLRSVLAAMFGVDRDQVLITTGASEALLLALTAVTDHGAPVAMPRPAFPGFEQLAGLLGVQVLPYAVPGATPRRGPVPVLVCSPHNPTGVETSPGRLGDGHGWVIWDLSHMSTAGPELADFTAELGAQDIVVFSLSKLLRLPGARVGALIATDPALLAAAARAKTHLSMSTSCLSQDLALRVLNDPTAQRELSSRAAVFAEQRVTILDAVAASPTVRAIPASAGTHVFVEHRGGHDAWEYLNAAGVVGIPGPVFNAPARFLRLCIAQPGPVIAAAADRMRRL
ncbi:pyridoxal phosphate-dependent aminotransferase [Nocardia sp. NPDC048505]|uniref:pyridoxal phosphate-dependent aminotransferase n=1 Tax=Nocardia sp. NPDC048505 TaxID=3155756 RepID=UPI0033C96689